MACIISGMHNSHEIVEKLLQHPEVDVNAKDNSNETPLHTAVRLSLRINAVEKLLNHPFIDINRKNNNNQTPFDLIQQNMKQLENSSWEIEKQGLRQYENMEKMFEEFPVKRRWNAYCYFLNIPYRQSDN